LSIAATLCEEFDHNTLGLDAPVHYTPWSVFISQRVLAQFRMLHQQIRQHGRIAREFPPSLGPTIDGANIEAKPKREFSLAHTGFLQACSELPRGHHRPRFALPILATPGPWAIWSGGVVSRTLRGYLDIGGARGAA
jgi:hypothetical protein